MKPFKYFTIGVIFIAIVHVGCGRKAVIDSTPIPTFTPVLLGDRPGVHNVIQLNDLLFSGSSPEGEAGFQSLRDLGIKTIISVDGAKPDTAMAERFGLRYLHLPIRYDGVPRETALKIARAIRDLPGPAYVHCHHGKHRGPAAAMAALRCMDRQCPPSAALDLLRLVGTDPKYQGLYSAVESSTVATTTEWESVGNSLTENPTIPDFVRLMVGIDERWDSLKLVRMAGWKTPADHPDIDPAHEALLLKEHFREAIRLQDKRNRNEEFQTLLMNAEVASADLERELRTLPIRTVELNARFGRSAELCTKCHERFRDR